MIINDSFLTGSEYISLVLRNYYSENGYNLIKLNKFEEYDFYSDIKDYLKNDNFITFTDVNGKLMALRPDVTLSILKNFSYGNEICKYFYNEKVYRPDKNNELFQEINQTGVECLGALTNENIAEVIDLALNTLKLISDDFSFNICYIDVIRELLGYYSINNSKSIINLLSVRNLNDIKSVLLSQKEGVKAYELIDRLLSIEGNITHSLPELNCIISEYDYIFKDNIDTSILNYFIDSQFADRIIIDFSAVNDINYYNGLVFKGYVNGFSDCVVSGGQYDNLLKKKFKDFKAIGFAVDTDYYDVNKSGISTDNYLNVALPKGRLGEK